MEERWEGGREKGSETDFTAATICVAHVRSGGRHGGLVDAVRGTRNREAAAHLGTGLKKKCFAMDSSWRKQV